MATKTISHVLGIDDAPFDRRHRGDVLLVGALFSGMRLDAVLSTKVRRDGANATDKIVELVKLSRFKPQLQLIMLQGIAFAGFNVVDIHRLQKSLSIAVMVVCRKKPSMARIRDALLQHVPGGDQKWRLIQKAGPMEPAASVYIQRAGLSHRTALQVLERFCRYSDLPEPLRTAHLVAGGVVSGESKHRA